MDVKDVDIILSIDGDGSFNMSSNELSNITDKRIKIALMNDEC